MFVKFKNSETEITTSGATEQKLFKDGKAVGWLLSLTCTNILSADELDKLLVAENIGEISLCDKTDSPDKSESILIAQFTGYTKSTACLVRYTNDKQYLDLQLTKGV